MAGKFSYGSSSTESGGFLRLEQKYVAGIIIAVVLAVAILGGAFILRPKPAPEPSPALPTIHFDNSAEIACLEGGGEWDRLFGTCNH
jgi:hypothetical protein